MERIIFELMSSHQMFNDHHVRTRGHLEEITAYVEDSVCRSLYPPGTPIGLIVSQSFSEPLTQIQLNRFHHSGEGSGLVSGVARIKEIINCMKDIQTPSMTIVPLDGHTFDTNDIVCVSIKRVIHCWTTKRANMVTLVLDRMFMISRCITPRLVAEAVGHMYEHVEFTLDVEALTWELWFPLYNDASSLQVRDAVRVLGRSNVVIKGIKNIQDFYRSTIDTERLVDGVVTVYKQPCIITKGSNLQEICKLSWVDVHHTTTNDLMEIYSVFGIDAMCTSLEDSLLHVMSSNSADVSRSYIHIIAHEMCRTGIPCALTFNGLTNSNTSTLKLATFERSLESFVRAARIGHTDHLRGISESVIVGKPVSVGTGGDFDLVNVGPIPVDIVPDPPVEDVCASIVYKPKKPLTEKRKLPDTSSGPDRNIHPPEPKRPCSVAKQEPVTNNPYLNNDRIFVPYYMDTVDS
jgi:DNA-directed RNA polymerase beta' subunit